MLQRDKTCLNSEFIIVLSNILTAGLRWDCLRPFVAVMFDGYDVDVL